jgi:succinoglycan biosynthesis transport protein ExoP
VVQSSLSPHVNPVGETEQGYGQLFAVLIRRFPWFLAILIACVAMAGVMTKRTPPTFKSSLQLLLEPNYQGKTEGGKGLDDQFADPNIEIDAATQIRLMQSSGILQKAVEKLKPEYPDITVEEIKGSLALEQIRDDEQKVATKLIEAQYIGTDGLKTQKVLEAVQQVYLDYNIEQQDERLKRGLKVIREQLKKVNDEVAAAESSLQRFRKTQKVIDPEAQAKLVEDELAKIFQERRTTRAQYEEALARYESTQKQLQSNPQNALVEARLSQSTRYQGILNEIQKTELALAQERLRFTDEAPSVQKFTEQLESQKALLQEEQRRTLGAQAEQVKTQTLLEQGQRSEIDLDLAAQLVETQTSIVALAARDQVLANKEEELRTDLKRYPGILAEYSRLKPQVELGRQRLQELLMAEQVLRQEISKGGVVWQVIEEPQIGMQTGPNLKQNLMLGAVVGIMLGAITAFVREAADDSVHTTAELEKQVSLPVLGTTPKLPPAKTKESIIKLPFGKPEVLSPWTVEVLQSPPRWESLDLIYKNIELMNSVSPLKSLMITSALPDEGKSALALGLAMSAARLHKRVLLIDANLRSPSVHKQLNLPNEQGLSTLLASDASLPNQINVQSSGSSYIDILTSGPTPADPAHLLSSPRMLELMAQFEQNYDLVIVDSSPVIGLVDAMITASSCRHVVMVASIGRVTRSHLTQATAMLSRLNLIGVVANGVSNSNATFVPYAKQQQQQLALQQAMEK